MRAASFVHGLAAQRTRWTRGELLSTCRRHVLAPGFRRWVNEIRQPALPPPAGRRVEPAPEAAVLPLLQTLAKPGPGEERAASEAAVSKLGLSALEPLRRFEAALPADDPARAGLEKLERQLACTVADATLETPPGIDGPWSAAMRTRLDSLRGQPMTSAAFVALVADTAGAPPKGAAGFTLEAARDEDFGGVRIVLKLLDTRAERAGTFSNSMHERVGLGADSLYSSSGSSSLDYLREAKNHRDFARAADRALSAAADQPCSLLFSILFEQGSR